MPVITFSVTIEVFHISPPLAQEDTLLSVQSCSITSIQSGTSPSIVQQNEAGEQKQGSRIPSKTIHQKSFNKLRNNRVISWNQQRPFKRVLYTNWQWFGFFWFTRDLILAPVRIVVWVALVSILFWIRIALCLRVIQGDQSQDWPLAPFLVTNFFPAHQLVDVAHHLLHLPLSPAMSYNAL